MLQQAIAAIRWTTCGNTPEDRGVIPTLWLTGTAGVGKSATAWHAFNASTTDALGYVDVDQVGMLYPDDDVDEYGYSLKNDAICALARNFAAAGAGRLLVSGIVDPREPGRAVRLDRADLRYCLLTVDDEVLRGRVAERGWDSVEADTIVAEQAELKDSSFAQAVIDTTEQTVGSVAERVMAELTALPPAQNDDGHVADAHQQVAMRSLFITGTRGVGCSTVGFGLARHTWSQGTRTGFADLGQLSFVRLPGTDTRIDEHLGLFNLATLGSVFANRGAEVFIGNGHLMSTSQVSELRQHLPGTTVIRLRADEEALRNHIHDRFGGNEARLIGDDLAHATPAHQEWVLNQALRGQQQMDGGRHRRPRRGRGSRRPRHHHRPTRTSHVAVVARRTVSSCRS